MAWTVHGSASALLSCPYCASPLLELSDMWGTFYGCDECGYEVDALETHLEMKHPRPLREPVFAGSYRLDRGPYLEGSGICQVSGEAPGSPWAS